MHNTSIFKYLIAGAKASQLAIDLEGRQMTPTFGVSSNNDDPSQLRRIKTSTESKALLTENDFAVREMPCPYWDAPMPVPGQAIATNYLNGNPHDAYYSGVLVNAKNPPFPKNDPVNDDWRFIPGTKILQINGDKLNETKGTEANSIGKSLEVSVGESEQRRIEQDLVINCGKSITLQNDAGASITLLETGAVVLSDAWGKKLILSGGNGGSGAIQWDLNGNSLNIINAQDVTIANKSIATINARDTRGDRIVERGW